MKYCRFCGKEISKNRVYCSYSCASKDKPKRKGWNHSPETIEKMKISRKNQTFSEETCRKISKAKSNGDLPSNWKERIDEGLKTFYWVTNVAIMCDRLNFLTTKNLKITKNNAIIVRDYMREVQGKGWFFPTKIQKWSLETMESFKTDILSMRKNPNLLKSDYETKYGIKWRSKTFDKLLRYLNIYDETLFIYEDGGQTKPEAMVFEILRELGVSFKTEVRINSNRWRVDFVVEEKLAVEVQGTYWHADPRVYEEKDLNSMQQGNKKNDKKKKDWLLSQGFHYLEIWEGDLYNSLSTEKNKIVLKLEEIRNENN